jgi:hypothetical protein
MLFINKVNSDYKSRDVTTVPHSDDEIEEEDDGDDGDGNYEDEDDE